MWYYSYRRAPPPTTTTTFSARRRDHNTPRLPSPPPDSAHPRTTHTHTHTSSYRVSDCAPPVTLSLHHAHLSKVSPTCEQLTSPVEQNAADNALASHHCLRKPQNCFSTTNDIIGHSPRPVGARAERARGGAISNVSFGIIKLERGRGRSFGRFLSLAFGPGARMRASRVSRAHRRPFKKKHKKKNGR